MAMLASLRRRFPERVQLDQRRTLFCLRAVVSVLMFSFAAYNPDAEHAAIWLPLFLVGLHAASNVALLWAPPKVLEKTVAQGALFLFDIAIISGLIYVCEGFDSDLYLIYFVVVLMSGLQMRVWQSLLIALAACVIYLTLWSKTNPDADLWDTHILLRLPFFYIVAMFSSFFAHQSRQREEKVKEESLKDEREKLRAVFGQMADAAVLTDGAGAIVLYNEAARRYLGIKKGGKGTIDEQLATMRVEPSLERLLQSKEPSVAFEAHREEPKKLVLAGAATLLRFEAVENKSPWQGHLFVFRDVTTERHDDLCKRSFLFLIGHKLKTPLTSVNGFAQMMSDEKNSGKITGETRQKAMEKILFQGRKLNDLIEKLLDFVNVESLNSQRLEQRDFDLEEAVAEVEASLRPWLAEKKAALMISVPRKLKVHGDDVLLRRALKNLIENGVKFNGKHDKIVRVWAESSNGSAEIHVADNGDGIPPEDRDLIFKKFYQSEEFYTGNVEGWGLGLPFVKKVVEFHGSSLGIDSRLKEGTTVSFKLPAR